MEIMPALRDTSSATAVATQVHPPQPALSSACAREPLLELFVLIDLAVQSPVK